MSWRRVPLLAVTGSHIVPLLGDRGLDLYTGFQKSLWNSIHTSFRFVIWRPLLNHKDPDFKEVTFFSIGSETSSSMFSCSLVLPILPWTHIDNFDNRNNFARISLKVGDLYLRCPVRNSVQFYDLFVTCPRSQTGLSNGLQFRKLISPTTSSPLFPSSTWGNTRFLTL